jgi:hypothetical protein
MNPHRKFKNRGPDGFGLVLMFLILCFIGFVAIVLEPAHKKNIDKLKQPKPLVQQYLLNQSDPVWFYKPDELEWTKGEVIYLWGYHPVVYSKQLNKTFKFHEIEWTVGNE